MRQHPKVRPLNERERLHSKINPLNDVKITLGFDVYGTLVDPCGMAKHLAHDLGVEAADFADFWREKQLEYSFRRGLMQNYADFSICTSDALDFTSQRFKVVISSERRAELLGLYQHLPPFDDVTPALHSLQAGFRLFAFSNGKRSEIDAVYVQDYGAPVGYRIASKYPQAVDAIIVQNGNAHVE